MQRANARVSRNCLGVLPIVVSVVLLIAGLSLAMMPTVVAGATGSSGVWGTATELTGVGTAHLTGVSCSDATDCTAVGYDFSDTQPVYAIESSGVWGAVTELPDTGGGEFTAVSCTSATNCTAVGATNPGVPMYATESAGVWGAVTDVPAGADSTFEGVSCTNATNCTAVGQDGDSNDEPFYATESAGVWGAATEITATTDSVLDGVSCTAATDCTAVGYGGNGDPIYAIDSSGSWSAATEIPHSGSGYFDSVSCTTASNCTAVGFASDQPLYATESDGVWGAPTKITASGDTSFLGVSCSDATDCTAVGIYNDQASPFYATETGGVWGSATRIFALNGGYFNAVSCTAATSCTAVGLDGNAQPIYATSTVDGAPTIPTISNLPASGSIGGDFTATVTTNGDGVTSVTSNSTGVCTVSGLVVSYIEDGTCSLTAHVAAGTDYGPADGVAQTFSVAPPPGPYSPLAPVRICDTRPGNPSDLTSPATQQCNGVNNAGSPIGAQGPMSIKVTGMSFGVPSSATAAVLNVTVVGPAATGHLSVYPAGATPPTASNINYTAGQTVANLVEVGVGISGQVSFSSSAMTNVIVDLEGYVSSTALGGSGAGLYNPLSSPARLCDTRAGNPSHLLGADTQCSGDTYQGETLSAGGIIPVHVGGDNLIPSTATAAVLNVTVANPNGPGHLTVYPQGSAPPTASNVNYVSGQVTANRVIVPLSASGEISVLSSAAANVIVDVSGYYSAPGGTGSVFSAEFAPVRICDTRAGNPSGLSAPDNQCTANAIGPGATLPVKVTTLAGVPANATAVVVNLTGVAPTAPTFLTVFPGPTQPPSSDLNLVAGVTKANLVVATLNADGKISIFNNAGTTNAIVDVEGWYSPVVNG